MITEHQARQAILDLVRPGEVIEVPLMEAFDAFAAVEMRATVPIPGFDNSMMDGYALRAADSHNDTPLRVVGEQPAGRDLRLTLNPGEAIRIFTGAPIPGGADAVIMQEDVTRPDANSIQCREPVTSGENIRRAGADLCSGQKILSPGDRLGPAKLALLASQGCATVRIHRPPRVAVLSTGDELIAPGSQSTLTDGEVYNSNGVMLQAMCRQAGIREIEVTHCSDDLEATVSSLRDLIGRVDAIILSGGVSVGDHDHVRPALSALGVEPELWRVKVKPGKPFLFAQSKSPRPVAILGLPGNPVSSFVTFHLFVTTALRRLMGSLPETALPRMEDAVLTQAISNEGDRPHYIRGSFDQGQFTPLGLQQSHALASLARANALLRLEPGQRLEAEERGLVMRI